MYKGFLQSALAKESRAYGFTIAFWGSGAMLIKAQGVPELIEALSYGGGAILGFGLLTLLAYRRALDAADYEENRIMILGMIHYIGALLPVVLAYYFARISSPWSFLLTGLTATVGYNLGMLVEEALSEKAERWEKRIQN